MSKKMPSGANFFKALIKEDIGDSSPLSSEEMPKQEDSKTTEINTTLNNSIIENVVKVMEQAAHAAIDDSESIGGSLPEVDPIHPEANLTTLKNTNEEQVKKKKTTRSTEDRLEASSTTIEPTKVNNTKMSPLTKRSIYFTTDQYLQIRIRAAQEDCDGSLIVRKAVDAYFNNNGK